MFSHPISESIIAYFLAICGVFLVNICCAIALFFFFNILGNESLSACSFLIIVAAVTRGIVRIELRLSEILERALIMALIDRAIACT